MNHLTAEELFQFLDGRPDAETKIKVENHLSSCPVCKRELLLQQNLGRAVKRLPWEQTSTKISGRVMKRVLGSQKASFLSKVLTHGGNILAMIFVLGFIGAILSSASLRQSSEGPSAVSEFFKPFTQFYAQAGELLASRTIRVNQEITNTTSSRSVKIVAFALLTFVVLAAIDRYVIPRLIRLKL